MLVFIHVQVFHQNCWDQGLRRFLLWWKAKLPSRRGWLATLQKYHFHARPPKSSKGNIGGEAREVINFSDSSKGGWSFRLAGLPTKPCSIPGERIETIAPMHVVCPSIPQVRSGQCTRNRDLKSSLSDQLKISYVAPASKLQGGNADTRITRSWGWSKAGHMPMSPCLIG